MYIILLVCTESLYESFLTTSSLQFGFKRGHSPSMCTMILKETIDYYRLNSNDVYCTMLDATKAFDRVEYYKLINIYYYSESSYCHSRIYITYVFVADSLYRVRWSS